MKMFHKSSKYFVSNVVIQEAQKVVHEALIEEIHQSFLEKYPHVGECEWSQFHNEIINEDDAENPYIVDIVASADMGWQKRSSGQKYDSPSGHMFLIGAGTDKVIDFELKCTSCSICHNAEKKGKHPRAHHCWKNFDGHAKAMEATAVAELVSRISERFHGKARVSTIIADDDSSMRSHCSHAGGLPESVHEPIFLADPSHRCKIIGKPLFKLAQKKI